PVRPPGHHACRARAMCFCIFNNVAVAARHAIAAHGLERVAIIDFDVHHGNGTEDIFSDDEHVVMASIFQHPFYPYSGTEDPAPNMYNVPLAAGSGGKELRRAVGEVWLPALHEFEPQLILFSAGFDAHVEDDMAMLRFVDTDYRWVTAQVAAAASAFHSAILARPCSAVRQSSCASSAARSARKCRYSSSSSVTRVSTSVSSLMHREARMRAISASGTCSSPIFFDSPSMNTGSSRLHFSSAARSWLSNHFCDGCGSPGMAPSTEPRCAASRSRSITWRPARASA